MAFKGRKGEIKDARCEADDEDGDGLEDEAGKASAVGVIVRREEAEGLTMGEEDGVQTPVDELTPSRRKSLDEHTDAEELRVQCRPFGRNGKLRGIKGLEGH